MPFPHGVVSLGDITLIVVKSMSLRYGFLCWPNGILGDSVPILLDRICYMLMRGGCSIFHPLYFHFQCISLILKLLNL